MHVTRAGPVDGGLLSRGVVQKAILLHQSVRFLVAAAVHQIQVPFAGVVHQFTEDVGGQAPGVEEGAVAVGQRSDSNGAVVPADVHQGGEVLVRGQGLQATADAAAADRGDGDAAVDECADGDQGRRGRTAGMVEDGAVEVEGDQTYHVLLRVLAVRFADVRVYENRLVVLERGADSQMSLRFGRSRR